MDSSQLQPDALTEGRRIYVGNLLYSITPTDIETLLNETGLGQYEKIHISVDPISGRNPGYCFIEFPSRELAEQGLTTLGGISVYNRPLKVGPCHPKTNSTNRDSPRRQNGSSRYQERPVFDRWGDWNGERKAATVKPEEQGPYGALQHLDDMKAALPETDGRRLYVGGLGKMIDQEQNQAELGELFSGFECIAIGKRITPHLSTKEKPGNHHYCFVDFATAEEAERARQATHGKPYLDGRLRVFPAKGKAPVKEDGLTPDDVVAPQQQQQPRSFGSDRRGFQSSPARRQQQEQRADETPSKEDRQERDNRQRAILATSNWRTRAAPAE